VNYTVLLTARQRRLLDVRTGESPVVFLPHRNGVFRAVVRAARREDVARQEREDVAILGPTRNGSIDLPLRFFMKHPDYPHGFRLNFDGAATQRTVGRNAYPLHEVGSFLRGGALWGDGAPSGLEIAAAIERVHGAGAHNAWATTEPHAFWEDAINELGGQHSPTLLRFPDDWYVAIYRV
jgi:hypothetical protein